MINQFLQKTTLVLIILLGLQGCTKPEEDTVHTYIDKAKKALNEKDYKTASIQLQNALLLEPTHQEARLVLANTNLNLGDVISAEKNFLIIKKNHVPTKYWQVSLAQIFLVQKKYQILLDQINVDPTNDIKQRSAIIALRGHAYLGLDDIEAATELFNQSERLDRNNISTVLGKMIIYNKQKKIEQALELGERFVERNPNAEKIYIQLGFLYQQLNNTDKAIEYFKQALSIKKPYMPASLGLVYASIAQFKPEQGLEYISPVMEENEENPNFKYLQSLLFLQNKNIRKSQEIVTSILYRDTTNTQAQLIFAVTHMVLNEMRLAEEYLRRLYSKKPNNLSIGKLLAILHIKQQQYDKAKRIISKLSKKYPTDIGLKQLLSAIFILNNESNRAQKIIQKTFKNNTNQASLYWLMTLTNMLSNDYFNAEKSLKSLLNLKKHEVTLFEKLTYIQILLMNDNNEKALKQVTQLELTMPNSALILNIRGLIYWHQSAWKSAIKHFDQAIEQDPHFIPAKRNKIYLLFAQKQYKTALNELDNYLKKHPQQIDFIILKYHAYLNLEQIETAKEFLEQSQHRYANNVDLNYLLINFYIQENKILKALGIIDTLDDNIAETTPFLILHSKILLLQNQQRKALSKLHRAQSKEPTSAIIYYQIAQIQMELGQLKRAQQNLDDAVKYGEKEAYGLLQAELYLLKNKTRQAFTSVHKFQQRYKKSANSYEMEGRIYKKLGQYGKAIDFYKKAVSLPEYNTKILADLILLYAHTNQLSVAKKYLQRGLNKFKKDPQLLLVQALLLQREEKLEQALKIYQDLEHRLPTNTVLLNNISWILFKQDKLNKSLVYAKKAYKVAPRDVNVLDTYGWITTTVGELVTGGRLLEKAHRISPENPEIFLHTALMWQRRGLNTKSMKAAKQIIKHFPKTQYAKKAKKLLAALTEEKEKQDKQVKEALKNIQ